jgi:RNA polymerase sigma factor (sigma-70 family)
MAYLSPAEQDELVALSQDATASTLERRRALEHLFTDFKPPLRKLARGLHRHADAGTRVRLEVADLLAAAELAILADLPRFRPGRQGWPKWALLVGRHAMCHALTEAAGPVRLTQHAVRHGAEARAAPIEAADRVATEDDPGQEELEGQLEQALRALAPQQREAMRLRYGLAGQEPTKDVEAIARRLQVSRWRAESLLGDGLERLRQLLGGRPAAVEEDQLDLFGVRASGQCR